MSLTAGLLLLALQGAAPAPACRNETIDDASFVVCAFHPQKDDIRLFLNDAAGAPFGDFDPLDAALKDKGERLLFAMNAGMYRKDRSPVGLYVAEGVVARGLSRKDGPGNFHLKPNGVFFIDREGAAHVAATEAYADRFPDAQEEGGDGPRHATQSGPMLVINGAIHPKFLKDSDSRKRRNGVGVREDGAVVFALADTPVTFHQFATYFRDRLKTPNALYLDGTISRLYAPELGRDDPGLAMGPIVGVVAKAD